MTMTDTGSVMFLASAAVVVAAPAACAIGRILDWWRDREAYLRARAAWEDHVRTWGPS